MTQKEQPHSHRSVDQAGSQARSLGQRIRWYRARQGISQEALAETIGASSRSIRRWEQDLALPQGLYRERLCQALSINPQELFGAISLEEVQQVLWTVPFPRNPCFTGRETILQTLHELLDGEQPAALSGLGGIGKTQVAIEYAYRYAHDYSAVIWLAAETAEELIGSLQALAEQAQIPPRQMANQSQLVIAVQRWLAVHPGWLIIADNIEDPDLLNSVLPPLRQGALLITTRRQALGTLAAPLKLPSMSREEGITLILRRARRLDEQQTQPEVAELVRLLDGFPLALDQAGSYLEETGCSVADYLKRYQDQRQLILARRGSHGGAHPASVTTTLKLSVERVEREHPAAVDLLRVCAFLHPEAIPEELLSTGAPFLGPSLQAALADPYQFDQILAALRSASLVSRSPETRTLSVHRLVQAVLADWMEPEEAHRWQIGVIQMVNTAFPNNGTAHVAQCERYLTQALACVPLIEQCASHLPEASELLSKAGCYLMERGRYTQAEPLLVQAATLTEQLQNPDPLLLIERVEKQAELFWLQGRYEATERLLQRSIALEKAHLEPTHPRIGETFNNLALLYWYWGKYEQAEPLYQQALSIQEHHLGSDHREVSNTLDNLALLYQELGQYEQAEPLHRRALAIKEQQFGSDHLGTATTLNNLAFLFLHLGNCEQAEQYALRALHIYEQLLSPEDPRFAIPLNNLADAYQRQTRYEQAEATAQRALHLQEQRLNSDHPEIAITLNRLATIYRCQGNYTQAEPLYRRALRIREQFGGPNHPKLALILRELATLYSEQGRRQQAEPLYRRALAICKQRLGPGHPLTATILHSLATLYNEDDPAGQ